MNAINPPTLGFFIILTVTSAVRAQTIDWASEGTFDASNLPAGTAVNTFSSASVFDFVDVHFSHTVDANADLSELSLSDGSFEIAAANGDTLRGEYDEFAYALTGDTETYDGAGEFHKTMRSVRDVALETGSPGRGFGLRTGIVSRCPLS